MPLVKDDRLSTSQFRFYTADEYWSELIRLMSETKPGSRVLLTSMSFHPDEPPVASVMSSLKATAKRGVKTTLLIDAQTFLIKKLVWGELPGPLWPKLKLPKRMRQPYAFRLHSLEQLAATTDGEYRIINLPSKRFDLPVAGRSHIKLAIVDDQVFLGGCNLQGTKSIDLMVGLKDKLLADWLYSLLKQVQAEASVNKALAGQDICRPIDENTDLLIDAGIKKQSVILDSAIDLIDSAQDWILITCQFFPNGITAAALLRAKARGVKIEIIFSHPTIHGPVGSMFHRGNMLRERLRVPADFFNGMMAKEDTKLHAKLLASDKGTIIGSHNYVKAGVNLGTAEIALISHDPSFTAQALASLERARSN
ncbi:MAG TPA: phospholipase D-like domain-containing protein [Candidatus Binatia bacterium]|nr:phospholipase D-like domain-containing protein [Candidatus Binatia bacterium]